MSSDGTHRNKVSSSSAAAEPIDKVAPKKQWDREQQQRATGILQEEKQRINYPAVKRGGGALSQQQHCALVSKEATVPAHPHHPRRDEKKHWHEKELKRPHPGASLRRKVVGATNEIPRGQAKLAKLSRFVTSLQAGTTGDRAVSSSSVHAAADQPHDFAEPHTEAFRSRLNVAQRSDENLEEQIAAHEIIGGHGRHEESFLPAPIIQRQTLAEAMPVNEESRRHLPQAQQVNVIETEAAAARKRTIALRKALVLFAVGIFVLSAVVLLSVFLLRNDKSNNITSANETRPNTNAPTSLEGRVYALLPDYTVTSLEDPDSPQSQAYEWLLQDPALDTYSDWRILQRFALAAFFFGTGGPDWFNNIQWLDYNHHECQWHARDSFLSSTAFNQTGGTFSRVNITWVELEYANPCEEENPSQNINQGIYYHLWQWANLLEGTIPPELCLLTNLRSISLYSNRLLAGTLPSCIGSLSQLEALSVGSASISGKIPTEIGTIKNLSSLLLMANQLTGPIPSEAGLLTSLANLLLDDNVSEIV
jgi:hypothetical protein